MSYQSAFLLSIVCVIGSSTLIDFCTSHYPYTYSKCLKICSSHLDPFCLDDQLCFCNSTYTDSGPKDKSEEYQLVEMERAQRFGVDNLSFCKDSNFCSKTCQEIGQPSFAEGIVCTSKNDNSIKSCVCGI